MPIETPRLRLRRYRAADIPALVAALNDWSVAQWLARTPYPYVVGSAESFLADADAAHAAGRRAIADRVTDALLGGIGIEPVDGRIALGYWLGPAQWGRGIASEAVTALVAHGFATMGLERLHATTDPDNAASQRVLVKAGFRRIGDEPANPPTRRGHTTRPLFERRR
jgi:RimJ/RimL family protein N-acetyltransferase